MESNYINSTLINLPPLKLIRRSSHHIAYMNGIKFRKDLEKKWIEEEPEYQFTSLEPKEYLSPTISIVNDSPIVEKDKCESVVKFNDTPIVKIYNIDDEPSKINAEPENINIYKNTFFETDDKNQAEICEKLGCEVLYNKERKVYIISYNF